MGIDYDKEVLGYNEWLDFIDFHEHEKAFLNALRRVKAGEPLPVQYTKRRSSRLGVPLREYEVNFAAAYREWRRTRPRRWNLLEESG